MKHSSRAYSKSSAGHVDMSAPITQMHSADTPYIHIIGALHILKSMCVIMCPVWSMHRDVVYPGGSCLEN